MTATRVLVVDDSAVIRRILTTILGTSPRVEIAGIANDGREALDQIEALSPDLVTLDIEMPVMNGLEALREIRARHPRLPVIMFSTLTERGASATVEALSIGASDYVTKPSNVGSIDHAIEAVRSQLIPKIHALCSPPPVVPPASAIPVRRTHPPVTGFDLVAIGSSTGGPAALRDVLAPLPRTFPLPILVTQHMPPLFTQQLAERLDQQCELTVREATEGAAVERGTVLIAPGGRHMTVVGRPGRLTVHLTDDPPENFCRPSVDVTLRSAQAAVGGRVLVAMLTGMGNDGCAETVLLHDAGAHVVVQDAATSAVWGMPGAVVAAGAATTVLPLAEIAPALKRATAPYAVLR